MNSFFKIQYLSLNSSFYIISKQNIKYIIIFVFILIKLFLQDYKSRPLIVSADNKIFLDSDNKLYRIAYEFLISIADPIHRPTLMHYYKLTKYSLYTAMVLQYDPGIKI